MVSYFILLLEELTSKPSKLLSEPPILHRDGSYTVSA